MTDQQLLIRYVQHNDQRAFSALIERHVHWVNSMALRLVRDPACAADVTQAVFILLANKAHTLRREAALSGWLFNAARFISQKTLRDESRRRKHEWKAASMRSERSVVEWDELSPILDELVGRLRQSDRQAVLLRFYEQRSFPQIGDALEISEEAARKRVERALDQLRKLFAKRGVTIGAAALTIILTENLTHPASAAVLTSTTAAIPAAKTSGVLVGAFGFKVAAVVVIASTIAATVAVEVGSTAPSLAPATASGTQPAVAARTSWTGRVVDEDGKPVANAKVWPITSQYGFQTQVADPITADARGWFETKFTGDVIVWSPGFGISGGHVNDDDAEFNQITIEPATQVRLRLIGPDGKPLANVRAAAEAIYSQTRNWYLVLPLQLREQFSAMTDADGVCVLRDMPQECRLLPTVLDDDRIARLDFDHQIDSRRADTTEGGTVRFAQSADISGKVTFADTGKPAAGMHVQADHSTAVTDEQGNYHLTKLGAGKNYIILDLSDDMSRQYTAVAYDHLQINAGDHLTGKDFSLIDGGIIAGKVTAKSTGQPLAGINVEINGPSLPGEQTSTQRYVKTAADGSYMMHVPPGKNEVRYWDSAPLGLTKPRPEYVGVDVLDHQTTTVNFALPGKPLPMIHGVATDPNGQPMRNVIVTVERIKQDGTMRPTDDSLTDAGGHFTIPAEDGVQIHARKGNWSMPQAMVIDAKKSGLTLVLQKNMATIGQVRVQQADGTAIANAQLILFEHHGGQGEGIMQKISAANGIAIFKPVFPDTSYGVGVTADGFGSGSGDLKIGDSVTVLLPKADSFIAGIVMDESGQPIAGLKIGMNGDKTTQQSTTTDDAGHFNFKNVVPGEKVSVYPYDRSQYQEANRTGYSFPAGTSDGIVVFKKMPTLNR